jgi:hypothetical protein
VTHVVGHLEIASLNIGVQQNALSGLLGKKKTPLGGIVKKWLNLSDATIFCLSHLGDYKKGVSKLKDGTSPAHRRLSPLFDLSRRPLESVNRMNFATAYGDACTFTAQGVESTSTKFNGDMHWQAFLVTLSGGASQPAGSAGGASQPAGSARGASQPVVADEDKVFGLILGNAHIAETVTRTNPTIDQKKKIASDFLDFLAALDPWHDRPHLSLVRVLVGDVGLNQIQAEEATQDSFQPQIGLKIQRAGRLSKWRVITTEHALPGDIAFVLGAEAASSADAIGTSWGNSVGTSSARTGGYPK